jgi:hypothetical protein
MDGREQREHERILIEMPTRMWLKEDHQGKAIAFEGFCKTRDLSIGGTFLESNYLLPVGYPLNLEMRTHDGDLLLVRGEIVHTISEQQQHPSGMGIMFTQVDAQNRERLLRFFVSDRIRNFYTERFLVEFPHLKAVMTLRDIALVINLWEDKEGRVTTLHRMEPGRAHQARREEEVRATKNRRHPNR